MLPSNFSLNSIRFSVMQIKIFLFIGLSFTFTASFSQNWDVKTVNIPGANQVIYLPSQDKLLVTTNDKVIIVNPYFGLAEDSIVTGRGNPIERMAISDDGQFLYLIQTDTNTYIYRYNLQTHINDLKINSNGSVTDIAVMPKHPTTLAVCRIYSVSIIDGNKFRPKTTASDFTYYHLLTSVLFPGSDSTLLYCSGEYGLTKVKVDITGTTALSESNTLNVDQLQYCQDGFLYSTSGNQINISKTLPYQEGIYSKKPLIIINNQDPYYLNFAPDPVLNKVYCTIPKINFNLSETAQVAEYNKTTFNLDTVVTLPVSVEIREFQKHAITWGSIKIASINNGRLIILRKCTSTILTAPTILEGNHLNFCGSNPITLSATTGLKNYHWSTGDTGRIIKVNKGTPNFPVQNIVYVANADAGGCLSPFSSPVNLDSATVTIPGTASISITDSKDFVCKYDSVHLFSNNANPNYVISWSTGQIGNDIWVKEAGNYSAFATAPNGCTGPQSYVFKINSIDAPVPMRPTIKIDSGNLISCGYKILNLSATSGYAKYKWSNGFTGGKISLTAYENIKLSVQVADVNGCISEPSIALNIETVKMPDIIPTITVIDNTFASSSSVGNQWYLNDIPVTDANKQFFKPVLHGTYTVRFAERGNCFSNPSNSMQF